MRMKPSGPDHQIKQQAASAAINLNQRLAYTLREAAAMLGVSQSSVYRLIKRGQLRSTSGMRRKLIGREELLKFLRS